MPSRAPSPSPLPPLSSPSRRRVPSSPSLVDEDGGDDGDGDDGDDDDAENGGVNTSYSMSRASKVIVESDEEQYNDNNSENDDDSDDDSDDDDDDDEILEGPALYAAVDAIHRQKEEKRAEYTTKHHFTRPEAMALYIELLARYTYIYIYIYIYTCIYKYMYIYI